MNRSTTLKISLIFLQLLEILLFVLLVVFALTLVYSMINPDAFDAVKVNGLAEPGFGSTNFKICATCMQDGLLSLNELSMTAKMWFLLRVSIFFVLTILIVRGFKKIVLSVKSKETFYEGNINNFKSLSRYGLIIAIFSSFNFLILPETFRINFDVPFGAIAFSLACLVLAYIFEEGKELTEDKNSIV